MTSQTPATTNHKTSLPIWVVPGLIGVLALLMSIVVIKAFVLEDAFIVFRSVRNFHQGFFFSALADVRSQSYTSNLWTLLLLLGGYISDNLPNVAITLSLIFTLTTATLLTVYCCARNRFDLAIASIGFLALSNTFTDYSTGGLENPLAHFILAVFLLYSLSKSWKDLDLLVLGFIAACLIANRYDQALLVAPMLGAVLWARRNWRKDCQELAIGFIPLAMWIGFSWFYYGSAFPDTYYAKIHTGIPVWERAPLAFMHHLRLLDLDPVGMVGMVSILGWGCARLIKATLKAKPFEKYFVHGEEYTKLGAILLGIALYNTYFFYAGGDYMVGRFMSVVMVGTVIALILIIEQRLWSRPMMIALLIIGTIGMALKLADIAIFVPRASKNSADKIVRALTFDQRRFQQNWYLLGQGPTAKDWRALGYERAIMADSAPYPYVIEHVSAGIIPYYAGPRHYLIDTLGLSDPLLARLPCSYFAGPAHCIRKTPVGYEKFIKNRTTDGMDADLAGYAIPLFQIKTLPLFSSERIKLLLRFTFGGYETLHQDYIHNHKDEFYKPGDARLALRDGLRQTILAPLFIMRNEEKGYINPLNW